MNSSFPVSVIYLLQMTPGASFNIAPQPQGSLRALRLPRNQSSLNLGHSVAVTEPCLESYYLSTSPINERMYYSRASGGIDWSLLTVVVKGSENHCL